MNMKNTIAEAFAKMVREKGVDKVTVKALIDVCNISRQTFYYHFQDIADVIEWSLERATQEVLSKSLQEESPQKAIGVFVSSTAQNYELICKLMDSRKQVQMEKMLLEACRKFFEAILLARCPELPLQHLDLEVMLDFWACGVTGILLKYCGKKHLDIDMLSSQIYRLLSEQMLEPRKDSEKEAGKN